jgi:hypothetical protein
MTLAGRPDWPAIWQWLQSSTLCPFARTARVRVSPAWDPSLSPSHNLRLIADHLRTFCEEYPGLRLHGFAMELQTRSGDAMSPEACTQAFAWVISALRHLDGQGDDLSKSAVEQPEWQFSFAGRRLFMNLFAPAYGPSHSKHLPPGDRVVVFAQPEESFDYCGVNPSRRHVKEAIRRRFADAGRPYPGELIDTRVEAHLYVFPCEPGGNPVRWWEYPADYYSDSV